MQSGEFGSILCCVGYVWLCTVSGQQYLSYVHKFTGTMFYKSFDTALHVMCVCIRERGRGEEERERERERESECHVNL